MCQSPIKQEQELAAKKSKGLFLVSGLPGGIIDELMLKDMASRGWVLQGQNHQSRQRKLVLRYTKQTVSVVIELTLQQGTQTITTKPQRHNLKMSRNAMKETKKYLY